MRIQHLHPKRLARIACAAIGLLAAAAALAPVAIAADDDDDGGLSSSQVRRGFEINPAGVQLNLRGKNRRLVGLGSYIVNTSGCNDCHTHPEFLLNSNPFRGEPEMINYPQFLSGGRMFGPILTSANLTPDAHGKPAGLTLDQFITTLRTGHNPNDNPPHILQVMPDRKSVV